MISLVSRLSHFRVQFVCNSGGLGSVKIGTGSSVRSRYRRSSLLLRTTKVGSNRIVGNLASPLIFGSSLDILEFFIVLPLCTFW